MFRLYKKLSLALFGGLADRSGDSFSRIKPSLETSGIRILSRTYISMIFLTSFLAYIIPFITVVILFFTIGLDIISFIYYVMFLPVLTASIVFFIFYLYPEQKASGIRKSIDNDLPFALAHMSAIVSSGIPPEKMFDLLTGFDEFRHVSRQAELIVRNIRTFGMSSINAIETVAKKTPSPEFKQILGGINSNIEKGGDLVKYLKEMSNKSLFDYRMRREKYLKTLSTYADIYTALLVAAPLMMLAVLGILSMIGGEILGLRIPDLITLITFAVLPALNVAFLAFIHVTYPGV
jgi:flagellar protein FlaJ